MTKLGPMFFFIDLIGGFFSLNMLSKVRSLSFTFGAGRRAPHGGGGGGLQVGCGQYLQLGTKGCISVSRAGAALPSALYMTGGSHGVSTWLRASRHPFKTRGGGGERCFHF